uniref:CRAL_TRIO_N domain-containing protein n=1 Tax=Anopheles atroparvus TaxID=41427 RepID=A0A182IJN6_ANOAO
MSNRVAYSFDKNRKVEESYKFTLPDLYRNIALEELREDDVVREQALTQMREWIVSNPHIRKCRVDAPFLLRFLRFRKFSVPLACEALEQYLTVREMYPSWYNSLDYKSSEMRRMQENMGISVLGQDSAGQTVVLIELLRMEKGRFTALEVGRFGFMVLEALLEMEDVQIGGILLLLDYTGINKLKELMEPAMTPQAYGGSVDLDELNKKFWERFEQQYEGFALRLDRFEIDLDHYSALWSKENPDMAEAKTFKNLNID